MREQDRQQLGRVRHPGESVVEGVQGRVRLRRAAERLEQARQKLGQHGAGAGGSHRGPAPEMPAAHGLEGAGRIGEAERR